jgi:hypothetical protein
VGKENRQLATMAAELFVRRIQQISFAPEIGVEDLTAFFQVIVSDPKELVEHGGPGKSLTARGVSPIQVAKSDFRRVAATPATAGRGPGSGTGAGAAGAGRGGRVRLGGAGPRSWYGPGDGNRPSHGPGRPDWYDWSGRSGRHGLWWFCGGDRWPRGSRRAWRPSGGSKPRRRDRGAGRGRSRCCG